MKIIHYFSKLFTSLLNGDTCSRSLEAPGETAPRDARRRPPRPAASREAAAAPLDPSAGESARRAGPGGALPGAGAGPEWARGRLAAASGALVEDVNE